MCFTAFIKRRQCCSLQDCLFHVVDNFLLGGSRSGRHKQCPGYCLEGAYKYLASYTHSLKSHKRRKSFRTFFSPFNQYILRPENQGGTLLFYEYGGIRPTHVQTGARKSPFPDEFHVRKRQAKFQKNARGFLSRAFSRDVEQYL